jgi:hypothetical protein
LHRAAARRATSLLAAPAPVASPSGPSAAAASAATIKLRDEALVAAQKLTDEAASLHLTNTERSKQLQEEAALLKSAADAQERVRAAADALEKERAQADALELQAAALRDRLRDTPPKPLMTMTHLSTPTSQPSFICIARRPTSRTSRT